jgi:hypothetical protein
MDVSHSVASQAERTMGFTIVDTKDSSKNQRVRKTPDRVDSWSRDGKYLLVDAAGHMGLLPLSGDQKLIPVGSPHGTSLAGRFSPDGKFIAFVSDESGQDEVYIQPMPPGTGKTKVSNGGGVNPRWRRDGRELFFASLDRGSIMAADVMPGPPFFAGPPHRLFGVAPSAAEYDVGPDGQRFLIYKAPPEAQDTPITVVLNWWAGLKQRP